MIDYSNQYERSVLSQSLICPKLIGKKVDFHQKITPKKAKNSRMMLLF